MPKTRKQRKAACTAYGMRKQGKKARFGKGMSTSKLREWCKAKKLHNKT